MMLNRDQIIIDSDERILITGAAGFIGSKVVETFLKYGFKNLICFVRPTSNIENLTNKMSHKNRDNLTIFRGNLLSKEDCEEASKNVSLVCHLAAGIEKSFAGCFMNSVVGTRNLLDALIDCNNLKRFLNVSSMAVYSIKDIVKGGTLYETSEVDEASENRYEAYSYGKIKQEEIIIEYNRKYNIPYVIVRPGDVYGPGKYKVSGKVGIDTLGIFIHLGGNNRIPLTYIDNCADAIVLTGVKSGIEGEIFNIIDDDLPTSRNFLHMYKKHVKKLNSIYIPYRFFYLLSYFWEKYSIYSNNQIPPVFNRNRCIAHWKKVKFTNKKLKEMVGWSPKVKTSVGLDRYFEYMRNAEN